MCISRKLYTRTVLGSLFRIDFSLVGIEWEHRFSIKVHLNFAQKARFRRPFPSLTLNFSSGLFVRRFEIRHVRHEIRDNRFIIVEKLKAFYCLPVN